MVTVPAHPVPRSGLRVEELDGELVIFDPATASIHHLDAVATRIWGAIDGRRSIEDIVTELGRVFQGERAQIGADVRASLAVLSEQGLVEEAPNRPGPGGPGPAR